MDWVGYGWIGKIAISGAMGSCCDDVFGLLYKIPNIILPCSLETASSSSLCVLLSGERKKMRRIVNRANGRIMEK
jgi:hypothetical protein